jgi:hypothetical protein
VKLILQVLLVVTLFFSVTEANDFREIIKISLKKDAQKKFLVKYDSSERLFKFRWTLYKNKGLVIFRSYDKQVSQNILYLNHKNQSFRVELKSRGRDFYNVPYILVKFKEFDYVTREAKFDLMLSDDKMQIILEELKQK